MPALGLKTQTPTGMKSYAISVSTEQPNVEATISASKLVDADVYVRSDVTGLTMVGSAVQSAFKLVTSGSISGNNVAAS